MTNSYTLFKFASFIFLAGVLLSLNTFSASFQNTDLHPANSTSGSYLQINSFLINSGLSGALGSRTGEKDTMQTHASLGWVTPIAQPEDPKIKTYGLINNDRNLLILLIILIGLLFSASMVLIRLIFLLKNKQRSLNGEPLRQAFNIGRFIRSRRVIAFVSMIMFTLLGIASINKAMNLGHSKGYAPEQPIAFSHKIHSGDNEIDCLYCHSHAEKSKIAGLPDVNSCMDCHVYIKTYPFKAYNDNPGTLELNKLISTNQILLPIEWIRVYNLPDFVFFNHAQHVKVAGIDCSVCHGPVKEMEILRQEFSFSMGWCVNCHRQTIVRFKTNEYYTMFDQLYKDVKSGKIKEVTADMVGGEECQKCHY